MASATNCIALPAAPAPALPCAFAFGAPTYLNFDLSPLAASYQQCAPANDAFTYLLALCGALPGALMQGCPSAPPATSSAQVLGGECFQAYGAAANATVALLERGLALTYSSAAQCSSGGSGGAPAYYATALALTCAPELPRGALVVDAVSASGCGVQYSARSAAACGVVVPRVVPPLGTVAAVLLGLGCALLLYLVGGTLYNRRVRGARGLEAVPHIGALRAAGAALGCRKGVEAGGGDYAELLQGGASSEEEYFSAT